MLIIPRGSFLLSSAAAAYSSSSEDLATVPLAMCDGSSYCVEYWIDGFRNRAVLDTGSPFLNSVKATGRTAFEDTEEFFSGSNGIVRWQRGQLEMGALSKDGVVFGVPDSGLVSARHGGLFLGLVKNRKAAIRPTLMEQLGLSSFEIDLRDELPTKTLKLSKRPMIPPRLQRDSLRLVDLRIFGAPVQFYAAKASALYANGRRVDQFLDKNKPLIVIFDTGVTGAQLSTELFDILGPLRQLRLDFDASYGDRSVSVAARRKDNARFIVTPVDLPWRNQAKCYVVALGLAFLDQHRLTVDVDRNRMLFN